MDRLDTDTTMHVLHLQMVNQRCIHRKLCNSADQICKSGYEYRILCMPANDSEEDNVLNSGVDLQFCVMDACENKEAAYEVLDFLMDHDSIQSYLDAQNAVPCKDEDFALAPELEDMKPYIQDNRMADYQDHYYPSEMAVDAQIQTFLINQDVDAFLKKFDKDWIRYNRDIIRMMEDYEAGK